MRSKGLKRLYCYVIAFLLTAFSVRRDAASMPVVEVKEGSLYRSKAYAGPLQQLSSAIINEASVSKNASAIKTGFQRLAALQFEA